MGKEISSMWVGLTGNVSGLSKSFTSAIAPIKTFSSSVAVAGSSMLAITGIGAGIGGVLASVASLSKGFSFAAEMEQNQVAFETMLGSMQSAKDLLAGLTQFSAATPFEFPEIAASAKKLLAFGVGASDMTNKLTMLGDIASGIGAPLEDIAAIYGKIKSRGQLTGETLNQMAERGIPIYRALATTMHTTESAIAGMVTAGKIGFPQVDEALGSLAGTGGQFSGMMAKQSKTLSGLMSTLSDNINIALGGIAQNIVDTFSIKDGISALISGIGTAGSVVIGWVADIGRIIKSFGSGVYNVFSGIARTITPPVTTALSFVSNVFRQLVPMVAGIGATLWNATTSVFQGIYNTVSPIITAVADVVSINWQTSLVSTLEYGAAIVGFVKASFGFILDIAGVIWTGTTAIWNWGVGLITGSTEGLGVTITDVFQAIVDAGNWLKDSVGTTLSVMEFAINNWRDVLALAGTNALLSIVTFGNETQYIFTEVIPGVLTWFASNWQSILTDLGSFTATVFSNLASNAVKVLTSIPSLISGSVSFSDLWTPLSDGFESTLSELPQIATRQMGDLESTLTASSDELSKSLSLGLGQALNERQDNAVKVAKAIGDGINNALTPTKIDTSKVTAPTVETTLQAKVNPADLTVGITPELKQGKAIRAGSAESQALQFGIAGLGSIAGGNGPIDLSHPQTPSTGQSKGMTETAQDFIKKQFDELVKQTGLLASIDRKLAEQDELVELVF